MIKASKLPPGPSKTSYMVKAKNARAMADALAYTKGEAQPDAKGDAVDEVVADGKAEAGMTAEATEAAREARIGAAEIDILEATPALGEDLTQIVNWAYRGKRGRQGWTGEMELLDGIRIAPDDMTKLLQAATAGNDALRVFVAYMESQGVIGCVKVERVSAEEAEIGMFSVDPGMQSRGVGSLLLDKAERYAKQTLKVKRTSMMVLDVREDLLAWYRRRGYVGTGAKEPFPTDANVGVPKRDLQFERYERAL
jgi:ribosomal protein S18 acetylase RimI-like enzyme